jgi:Tfp pilus assembly protein PilO
MLARHAGRLWEVVGAVGAVTLLAIGWFFFISPQKGQTSELRDEAAMTEVRLTTLQQRLVELRKQHQNLAEYRAQLVRDRKALPTTSGLSDFLRELQAAGDKEGVSVSGVAVGIPSQVAAGGTKVYSLPITLTADGSGGRLYRFLDQVQQVQPRAVLITSTSAVAEQQTKGSIAGSTTLTLGLQAFVAPTGEAGAEAPQSAGTPAEE